MINQTLISNLTQVLGEGYQDKKGQIKFFCPICHHYKKKLEVCIDDSNPKYQSWNCWTCGQIQGTKGRNIHSLFIKLNVTNVALLEYAKSIKPKRQSKSKEEKEETNTIKKYKSTLKLPEEYIPLYIEPKDIKTNIEYRNALKYLFSRGLTKQDILSYRIGYCESGKYANKIIIPSYDNNNQLNYFVGRAYYEDDYEKHKNPEISKNIIGFENRINWNYPITLVEGAFDAIAVKRNVIPLFGKTISEYLKLIIIEKKVTDIYLALDMDAIQDSLSIIEYFLGNGINVYTIQMNDKDPAKIGFRGMIELINNTKVTTFRDIIKMKINLK